MADSPAPVQQLDAQDPLPDPSWDWRRWFVALFFVSLVALRVYMIHMHANAGLTDWLIALVIICYLVAPSAEQITKMLATASLLRNGVNLRQSVTQTNTPTSNTSTAETTVTAAPEKTDGPEPASASPRTLAVDPAGDNGVADAPWFTPGPDRPDPAPARAA